MVVRWSNNNIQRKRRAPFGWFFKGDFIARVSHCRPLTVDKSVPRTFSQIRLKKAALLYRPSTMDYLVTLIAFKNASQSFWAFS
jgi:hypothetical protein